MFYETHLNNHGLPHDPFLAIIAPRPIGWITSMSAAGEVNLAPYSFFNGVSGRPPLVMFASEGRKDTLIFIEQTREFVCNLVTFGLRQVMNDTSAPYPRGVNEMERVGIEPRQSCMVMPPRVADAPCALECKWIRTISVDDIYGNSLDTYIVVGQVVGIFIEDRFIKDGLLDTAAMQLVARAGYNDYFVALPSGKFSMARPHIDVARPEPSGAIDPDERSC